MKQFLPLIVLLISSVAILAQPTNDECNAAIDLGTAPNCNNGFFSNLNATASDIGTNNIPTCFNVSGGQVQRDVWFSFTTDPIINNYDIIISGASDAGSDPLLMPQVSLYRGDCNTLDELLCASAQVGESSIKLEALGLLNNTTYFVRVNDFSTSATPNSGSFQICVQEFVPVFNVGETDEATTCTGTVFDSGGSSGDYGNGENNLFKICPTDIHQCLSLFVENFDIEENEDFLNVYAGEDNNAPLIAVLTGSSSGTDFEIQASSNCVTLEFLSDGFLTGAGFEISWECLPFDCDASSLDGVNFIPSTPFNVAGLSTCDFASTFASAGTCPNTPFLGGPERIFSYNSPGGECISVALGNAAAGTGVLVLNAPPNDPSALCIASSSSGGIPSASLLARGTYYIVVANAMGCTDFDIAIDQADCNLGTSLVSALCNPINNCATRDPNSGLALPTVLFFEDGFQDITVTQAVNNGCWDLSIGLGLEEPNFYWFSFEAIQDGDFGFIIQSADVASDLDFNVWGPFSNEDVCGDANSVVNFILNNQPIRSSYSGGAEPTGLVRTHPTSGDPVTDPYDCDPVPGPVGDDFASVIDAKKGEVYLVLLNDWQDNIQTNGILIDWSPTSANVLLPDPPELVQGDTAICFGDTAQLEIKSELSSVQWSPSNSLSCSNCLDPKAFPDETTTYQAIVSGACRQDTFELTVSVFSVDAGPDREVCLNENFQIIAGEDFPNATYSWTAPAGFLSCTDCPNPTVEASTPGTFNIEVELNSGNCLLTDAMILTVRNELAPDYEIIDDVQICRGDAVSIGGPPTPGVNFSWTSDPAGFNSTASNPSVSPTVKTTYFIEATNATCPLVSRDSVVVDVSVPPIVSLIGDQNICQGDTLVLASTIPSSSVTYSWTPTNDLDDPAIANPTAIPQSTTNYTLTATRGACVLTQSVNIDVTEILAEIINPDTVSLCLGEQAILNANFRPLGAVPTWTPVDGSLNTVTGDVVAANPTDDITYYVTVNVPGCTRTDSVFVEVDSLPQDLSILPQDTTICQGENVILESPIFDPVYFPDMEFVWTPGSGQLTGDSLYNLVVQPNDTTTYTRATTNGACVDSSMTTVNVKPIVTIMVEPSDPRLCEGESVDLQITNDEMLEELEWMPAQGLSCTDCLDPTASPAFTTNYMIMAEVDGCPAQGSVTVEVLNTPSLPAISGVVCLGTSINLNTAPSPFATYSWSADPADPTLTDPNAASPIVTPTQNTTYTVIIDNGSCDPVTTSIAVDVIGPQTLEVNEDGRICQGESFTLNANGSFQGRYFWTELGSGNVLSSSSSFTVTPASTTTYEVIYEYGPDGGVCGTLTETVTVTVLDNFSIGINANPNLGVVNQGQNVDLSGVVSPALQDLTYVWTDQNGNEVGTGANITVQPTELPSASYTLTVSTPEGCSNSATISFTVIPPSFSIPNAFTPDGDGVNDIFRLIYSGNVQLKSFQIFTRWGEIVFETTNIDEGWDGTKNGNNMPSDVYVYLIVLELPTGEEILRGDVTLIR